MDRLIIMDTDSWRCWIGLLVTPAYLCLTGVALSSTLIPFLRELALHGKTRVQHAVRKQDAGGRSKRKNTSSNASSLITRVWQYHDNFLRGDIWLVHKRCFLHFYIAGLVSLALFLFRNPTRTTAASSNDTDGYPILRRSYHPWDVVLLLSIHLLRRCYECLRIHQYSPNGKMHMAGYICGMFHYIFLPCILFGVDCNGAGMNVGPSGGPHVMGQSSAYHYGRLLSWGLCLWGQFEQYTHHCLLASLREAPTDNSKNDEPKAANNRHKIPLGRWFHYVSCPHYLAEILVYVAFASMFIIQENGSNGNGDMSSCRIEEGTSADTCLLDAFPTIIRQYRFFLSSLLTMRQSRHYVLVLWVAGNLTVTALRSHQWYLQTFPSYHALHRKAIFPSIL